mgnify:CR=1 FL=1
MILLNTQMSVWTCIHKVFEERKGNVYVLAMKNCIRLNIPVRPENISRKRMSKLEIHKQNMTWRKSNTGIHSDVKNCKISWILEHWAYVMATYQLELVVGTITIKEIILFYCYAGILFFQNLCDKKRSLQEHIIKL